MAKIGIVSMKEITVSKGLRLDAEYYVDPTRTVDQQIKTTKTTLHNAQKRLERLRNERTKILEERNGQKQKGAQRHG